MLDHCVGSVSFRDPPCFHGFELGDLELWTLVLQLLALLSFSSPCFIFESSLTVEVDYGSPLVEPVPAVAQDSSHLHNVIFRVPVSSILSYELCAVAIHAAFVWYCVVR